MPHSQLSGMTYVFILSKYNLLFVVVIRNSMKHRKFMVRFNLGLVMPQGETVLLLIVFSRVRCFPVFNLLSESAQDTGVDLGPGP